MPEGSADRLPSPERTGFKPLIALETRMLLAAGNPARIEEIINPNNNNVPEFQPEALTDFNRHDYSLFNTASTNERRKTAGVKREQLDAEVEKWANTCVGLIKQDPRANKLKRILGNPKNIDVKKMSELYSTYFTGENKASDIHQFVRDVVDKYREGDGKKINTAALTEDLDSIRWFARIFGQNSADIVSQLIDAEVRLENDPQAFAEIGNTNRNEIRDKKTRRLLTFLWNNRQAVQPAAEPSPPPPEPDKTPPQEPQPPEVLPLEKRFAHVVGTPNPDNKSLKANYFVDTVPDSIKIDPKDYASYESTESFFLPGEDKNGKFVYPNPKVVPYYYELADDTLENLRGPNYEMDPRFMKAEESTDGDSSFFALAAASARTPEEQAKLYRLYASTILDIHTASAGLKIRWLDAQGDPNNPEQGASMFRQNDQPGVDGISENQRLIAYDTDNNFAAAEEQQKLWQPRIDELRTALAENKIQPHHLRWIEFLSHSVDVNKIVQLARPAGEPAKQEDGSDLGIKILKDAKKQELIDLTKKGLEEPTVVETDSGNIPVKEELDIQILSLLKGLPGGEKLTGAGWKSRMNEGDNFTVIEPVQLPGLSADGATFYYQALRKNNENGSVSYTCHLFRRTDSNSKPESIAHVDFTRLANSDEANCSTNQVATVVTSEQNRNEFNLAKWNTVEAVKVDDALRGKGYGQALWYMAMSHAQLEGINTVNIMGDMTVGQRPDRPGESFYENMGADSILLFNLTDAGVSADKKLFARTFFLPDQESILNRLFGNPAAEPPAQSN